jgi:hypothetical protein
MDHWTTDKAITEPLCTDQRQSELPLFWLEGVLPIGQALSVNTDYLIISLVSMNPVKRNPILLQSLLTEQQMRVLLPLLNQPRSCPHEILLASLFCSWRRLLTGIFSTQGTGRDEWLAVVRESTVLLERAQAQGTLRKELKQLYNALSELRAKLRPFGVGIANCTSGAAYALIMLPAPLQQAHESA